MSTFLCTVVGFSSRFVDALTCSVCLDDWKIGDKCSSLPCKHLFHEACIMTWLKKQPQCPYCRAELVPKAQTDPALLNADGVFEI